MILTKIVYGVLPTPRRARRMLAWLREHDIPGEAIELDGTHGPASLPDMPLAATQYVRGGLIGAAFVGTFAMVVGLAVAYIANGPEVTAHEGILVPLGLIGAAFGAIAGMLAFTAVRKQPLREIEERFHDGIVVVAETGPTQSRRVEDELVERGATAVGSA